MNRVIFTFLILLGSGLSACVPETALQTPSLSGNLLPFNTPTPTITPEKPGNLALLETPLPSPTPFLYVVKAGDTLSGIALEFGVSLDDLVAANPEISPNSMSVGTELHVPSNPANPSGVSTPTPVSAPVKQVECYPSADRGMWCFVLVFNDTGELLENLSAQVTLLDSAEKPLASAQAISVLNILPPGASLPLMVFFPPVVPGDARPYAQMLTGVRLLPGDERYTPARLQNTLVQVNGSGRTAQVSGQVRLPSDANPASLVWVAAVAYDQTERVVGVKRWESSIGLTPGGDLPFTFSISSMAGEIARVTFVVEARP